MLARLLALSALLAVIPMTAPAETFTLSFQDGAYTNTVSLTATSLGLGEYLATSAAGSIDGQSVALLPAGTYPPGSFANDNAMHYAPGSTSPVVDTNGLSFLLAGTGYYNFFSTNLVYREASGASLSGPIYGGLVDSVSLVPAATPEPSSFALLGTGLVGLLGAFRLRVAA